MNQRHGRIVVGVDGSPDAKKALRWAADQAELTGAELDVVTAWERPSGHRHDAEYTEAELPNLVAKGQSEVIRDVLGDQPECRITTRVSEDMAVSLLLAASADADLLVLGSRGRGGAVGMLGSVSHQCVQRAQCPVVVIPHSAEC